MKKTKAVTSYITYRQIDAMNHARHLLATLTSSLKPSSTVEAVSFSLLTQQSRVPKSYFFTRITVKGIAAMIIKQQVTAL